MRKFAFFLSVVGIGMGANSASAAWTYLALGDSIGYGYQPIAGNFPSNGDRDYVAAIADAQAKTFGARPNVVNLSIPAETSSSFFDLTNPYRLANTNYFTNPASNQFSLAQQSIVNAALGGSPVRTVSYSLGSNDLFDLIDSGYLFLTPAQQAVALTNTLNTVAQNYTTTLYAIRTALPTARLILPGFYNPYPASSPLGAGGDFLVGQLNSVIQQEAYAFHGRYVDFFSPIEGNQLSLTYIATGDVHPNDAGYAALSKAAIPAAVPAPGALVCFGIGLFARRLRRRA